MLPSKLLSRITSTSSVYRFQNVLKRSLQPKCFHRHLHLSRLTKRIYSPGLQKLSSSLDLQIQTEQVLELPLDDPEDEILSDPDFFNVKGMVTLRDLFNARVHYGHKIGCRSEFMTQYLFGSRLDIDIIDLEKTLPLMHDALNFMAHIAYRRGVIMFVSRNLPTIHLVEKTAKECGEYSQCRLWEDGLFMNAKVTFKEEIRMPDLCILLDTRNSAFEQHMAVRDCAKLCIPTIAIVDTNCDPRLITYPIPGNDDTPAAVEFYCNLFKQAILKGKEAAGVNVKETK